MSHLVVQLLVKIEGSDAVQGQNEGEHEREHVEDTENDDWQFGIGYVSGIAQRMQVRAKEMQWLLQS